MLIIRKGNINMSIMNRKYNDVNNESKTKYKYVNNERNTGNINMSIMNVIQET